MNAKDNATPVGELIDLHVHTTASDGDDHPSEVVRMAAEKGLAAIAITDHDTLGGIAEAVEAGERLGVEVVPGIEISVSTEIPPGSGKDGSVHLLVYFVRPDGPVAKKLPDLQRWRSERNEKMLETLRSHGVDLTMDEVRAFADTDGQVGRPAFAKAIASKQYVKIPDDAYGAYIGDDAPCYVQKQKLPLGEAIKLARAEDAVPVLAHPRGESKGLPDLDDEQLRAALTEWKEWGLLGVEVDYPQHSEAERRSLRAIAEATGLVATGGSDYHGLKTKKGLELGTGVKGNLAVRAGVLSALKQAAELTDSR